MWNYILFLASFLCFGVLCLGGFLLFVVGFFVLDLFL